MKPVDKLKRLCYFIDKSSRFTSVDNALAKKWLAELTAIIAEMENEDNDTHTGNQGSTDEGNQR